MVDHPEEHAHVFARLLWGHAEVGEEDRALDERGRLALRRLQHWHGGSRWTSTSRLFWERQRVFVKEWQECGHSWVHLFKSEELRSRLSYVDVAELRTAFYLKGWPSLGDTSEEYPFQECGNTCALFWKTRADNVDASLISLQHFAAIISGPSSRWQLRR